MFGRKRRERVCFCIDKISFILEDKHVRKKRGHICPEDTLRTILSVKKWTFFLGVTAIEYQCSLSQSQIPPRYLSI